ncbi:putative polyhydroxybutyrate depolymerase [alpha proteobacterium BAL199]|nr:putative polyhydroxybutyrate depolymerase [alpha proteobacterium BAL199]
MQAFDRHGVLVIAPDGVEGSWAHQGSPSSRRDENAFLDALLADIARRWPIDPARRWASGFSQGGSMAWHAACYRGRSFTAFFPVAGAFWRPHPASCSGGPVNLLHTHGTADTVVPMAGRPIRQTFHQGDVREGIEFWAAQDGCTAGPARIETVGQLNCEIWSPCAGGREVRLCLHPGGHMIPSDWAEMALTWAERVSAR